MVITPIQKTTCPNSRAGLFRLWAIDCADVVDVLVENGNVYNVTLVDGAAWKQIQFDKGTGYLQQEKLIARGYETYVKQSLYFELAGLSNEKRNALEDLNGVCCMNVIAEDVAGNFHYIGISEDDSGDITNDDLRTGEGSSETGADPNTDTARYTESLVCFSTFYAPITINPNDYNPLFWTLAPSSVPTTGYWLLPEETHPDGGAWTIKNV